mgnify:CR=1 FL=1
MILYQLILSHLVFDYGKALTPEMIKAKSKGYPYFPIAKHAFLHAIGVCIVLLFNSVSIEKIALASLFEFSAHFFIDVMKGRIETKWSKLKDPTNPYHWHLFQIDQFLHISCKYLIYLFV